MKHTIIFQSFPFSETANTFIEARWKTPNIIGLITAEDNNGVLEFYQDEAINMMEQLCKIADFFIPLKAHISGNPIKGNIKISPTDYQNSFISTVAQWKVMINKNNDTATQILNSIIHSLSQEKNKVVYSVNGEMFSFCVSKMLTKDIEQIRNTLKETKEYFEHQIKNLFPESKFNNGEYLFDENSYTDLNKIIRHNNPINFFVKGCATNQEIFEKLFLNNAKSLNLRQIKFKINKNLRDFFDFNYIWGALTLFKNLGLDVKKISFNKYKVESFIDNNGRNISFALIDEYDLINFNVKHVSYNNVNDFLFEGNQEETKKLIVLMKEYAQSLETFNEEANWIHGFVKNPQDSTEQQQTFNHFFKQIKNKDNSHHRILSGDEIFILGAETY